jgi:N-acetyl-alpha-D-muramate 1-phosphate uridylyltransferase
MQECAILAGGLATRLRPLTETVPKVLLDVAGEPFLAHQLRLLARQGIRHAVLCTGYLGEQVRDYAGDGSRFGLQLDYSPDGPVLLGTAGALRQALPLLGDPFFVVYGDSYLPCDWQQAGRAFLDSGQLALMTVFRNEGQWDTSNVEFGAGAIRAYDKKLLTPAMRYIDYGLGAFHHAAFQAVPPGTPFDLALLYQQLLATGQLAGYEVSERFYEIGSFTGLNELTTFLLSTPGGDAAPW